MTSVYSEWASCISLPRWWPADIELTSLLLAEFLYELLHVWPALTWPRLFSPQLCHCQRACPLPHMQCPPLRNGQLLQRAH